MVSIQGEGSAIKVLVELLYPVDERKSLFFELGIVLLAKRTRSSKHRRLVTQTHSVRHEISLPQFRTLRHLRPDVVAVSDHSGPEQTEM